MRVLRVVLLVVTQSHDHVRDQHLLAVRALRGGPEQWLQQSLRAAVAPRPAVPGAADAFVVAAQPQVGFAVFVERADLGQRTLAADPFEQTSRAEAVDRIARAGPEDAIAILAQREDPPAGRRHLAMALPLAPRQHEQSRLRARPHPSVVMRQRHHMGRRRARRQRQHAFAAGIEGVHAPPAAHPERAVPIHVQRQGAALREGVQHLQPIVGDRHHAAACRHQQPARGIRGQGQHFDHVAFARRHRDRAHPVALAHRQALGRTDPQATGAVGVQGLDPGAGQLGRGVQVEIGEAHAVEAAQAGLRAEPQVARLVLGDRQHAELGQALFQAPVVAHVVVERLGRVQRVRRRTKRGHPAQQGQAPGRQAAPPGRAGAAGRVRGLGQGASPVSRFTFTVSARADASKGWQPESGEP